MIAITWAATLQPRLDQTLDTVEVGRGEFLRCGLSADVVLFEFCLHQMADPAGALARLAPDVVVLRKSERLRRLPDVDVFSGRGWFGDR